MALVWRFIWALGALLLAADSDIVEETGAQGIFFGHGVVKAIQPTFVPDAVDGLLDDCLARVEPIYQECAGAGAAGFAAAWNRSAGRVADALLSITDGRAQRTRHATAKKAYEKLRPAAKKNVEEAAPGLGQLLQRHAGP